MKRIILAVIIALSCALSVLAQQPSAEQQQQFSALIAAQEKAQLEATAAQAHFEAAQARVTAFYFQVLALLKLSPVENKIVQLRDGAFGVEKIIVPEPMKKE